MTQKSLLALKYWCLKYVAWFSIEQFQYSADQSRFSNIEFSDNLRFSDCF